jgi:hypothetical protein
LQKKFRSNSELHGSRARAHLDSGNSPIYP